MRAFSIGSAAHFAGYAPVQPRARVVIIGQVANGIEPAVQDTVGRRYRASFSDARSALPVGHEVALAAGSRVVDRRQRVGVRTDWSLLGMIVDMAAGVIDVWMQHPTLRHSQHEMFDSLRRWLGTEIPTAALPLDVTIRAMDEGGVDVGLTAAWYGPAGDLINNDEVAECIRQYPGRLRGVAGADLRRPMEATRDLRRRVAEGFVALRIVPWLWELPPTDRHYYPLYAACVDLGIPFCTQVGHTGPLRPSETGRPIPISTRWRSISRSSSSSVGTSGTRGRPR